jgi:hypothetical protein
MARRGPKPPLEGDALDFARDCAALMNVKSISDVPTADLRAMAERYARRVGVNRPLGKLESDLGGLRRHLAENVIQRMDHEAGFMVDLPDPAKAELRRRMGRAAPIDPQVAVKIVEGMLTVKRYSGFYRTGGQAWATGIRQPPWRLDPQGGARMPTLEEMMRSRLPEFAVNALMVKARYWPWVRCQHKKCRRFFVPSRPTQRFCGDRCRGLAHYHRKSAVLAAQRLRARKLKAMRAGKKWTPQRRPGAGRPRKTIELRPENLPSGPKEG